MIFRFVSIRHGNPFSIREMVMGDTLAARASSALLIKSASLALFKAFSFIGPNLLLLGGGELEVVCLARSLPDGINDLIV